MVSMATDDYKVFPKAEMSDLQSLLFENSTRKYYIEYDGFMSNHLSHGIIALYRLGATVDQIQRFIEWYRQKLEPAAPYMEDIADRDIEVSALLGARSGFYTLVHHYERQLKTAYSDSLETIIAENFPLLSAGLAGSALHGLIHLGYGYAAKNSRLVCEGLAYLHHSYIAPQLSDAAASSSRPDSMSPIDVANELRNNIELCEFVISEKKKDEWQRITTSDFQRSLRILFLHHGDYMYDLAKSVKLPDVDPGDKDAGRRLGTWAVNTALTVYATASRLNDFFLIHGVTGAWSLLQLVQLLTDFSDVLSAIRSFLCTLFTVYVVQGTLELQLDRLQDPPDKSLFSIVQEVLSGSMVMDEHVFKLVQVCIDMHENTADPALRNLYTWAATTAVSYTFGFP